jgi:hypothetical protein
MPRRIAKVELGTDPPKTIYFFGLTEVYSLPDQGRREEFVLGGAYDARSYKAGKKATSALIVGAQKKTAKTYVADLAEEMVGKQAAYCDLGRERSAVAVFSFLYVKLGLSKDAAAQKVVAAVIESVQDLNQKEKDAIIAQVGKAITFSEGFQKLPSTFAEG